MIKLALGLGRHTSYACAGPVGRNVRRFASEDVLPAYAYCIEQVRKYDYDNYVWMAQLQKEHRPAMFMLRAFNIDTALVADSVRSKETPLVQVRYQWWRDGVAAAFKGNPPGHPVLIALQDVVSKTGKATKQPAPTAAARQSAEGAASTSATDEDTASSSGRGDTAAGSSTKPSLLKIGVSPAPAIKQYHLRRLIDTREQDVLDPQPPLGVEGLERYAEGTASQLLYLQLGAVGVGSREADHAASHVGKAVGLATLLKGTAFHASQRRSYLPIDLCVKHNVSQEDVYSGQSSEGMRDVVLAVASVAKGHLDEARALSRHIPRQAAAVMLPAVACDSYLQALERVNFDVFSPVLQPRAQQASSFMHVLRIKYHLLMGTF